MRMRYVSHGRTSRLDLNLLELFENIWQTRNLTATGAALGLSQPAVSRGLACLRETYGDALFVRQQRGVEPTPLAESLAEPISAALAIVRATIDKPTFDPAVDARTFRLALSDIGERHFMPRLSAWLAANASAVDMETRSPSQAELAAGLATGEIDIAVGLFSGLGKQVHQQRLFREHFVYIARRDHPTVRGRLDVAELRTLPHVIGNPGGTHHAAAVEKVLTSPRVRAPIKLRAHSFLSIGPIVGASHLVAVVPSRLAAMVSGHVGLQIIAPPVRFPEFDISMVWHKRFNRDPGNIWLRGVFQSLFAGD